MQTQKKKQEQSIDPQCTKESVTCRHSVKRPFLPRGTYERHFVTFDLIAFGEQSTTKVL